jgi:ankyrin repeat protein
LHFATANGHAKTVAFLLERGADINAKDKDGRTALHAAAANGHDAIVVHLLERGADINAKDKDGRTALNAAKLNHRKPTEMLLSKASLNRQLLDCAKNGEAEKVEELLKEGADIESKNKDGETALFFSASNGHVETSKILSDAGANIKTKNIFGYTGLQLAAKRSHAEIVALFPKESELQKTSGSITADTAEGLTSKKPRFK